MSYGRLLMMMVVWVASGSYAWSQLTIIPQADKTILKPVSPPSFSTSMLHFEVKANSLAKPAFLDLRQAFQLKTIQLPNYQVKDLAFFCRLEVRLEAATRIPVRFRLGDVQYVDHLEGKIDGALLGY